MRLEITLYDKKLEFDNSLFIDEYVQMEYDVFNFQPTKLSFVDLHYILNEKNKFNLELAFQHQKQECIDGR
jgi:hypothetical protein